MRSFAVGLLLLLVFAGPAFANEDLESRPALGYRNGRPIKIRVAQIGWVDVELRTAQAFVAMQAAAERDGVQLWIRSGFRTHEEQAMFYQAWREGWGNRAARPGYSNHQSGRALDIDLNGHNAFGWLEANARRFGFKRTVAREPWHWEYVGRPSRARRARR
jgi:D-alanyl-D-alanine carboxypeptidase